MTNKLLISSCLLGQAVRYDGQSKPIADLEWLDQLRAQGLLFSICPEVSGGLPVPRAPAEMKQGQVITTSGEDVTTQFNRGADLALALCKQYAIGFALLKANSPSCGNKRIYDGSFSGQLIDGEGVTAKLLRQHDIRVYSELEIEQLQRDLLG